MSNSVTGYPFVDHVDQSARPTISDPKEFLKRAYVAGFTNNDNLIRYGAYRRMGYRYDFKAFMKQYVYKQYDSWYEAWAPNKTLLRQVIGGKITKIVQI